MQLTSHSRQLPAFLPNAMADPQRVGTAATVFRYVDELEVYDYTLYSTSVTGG